MKRRIAEIAAAHGFTEVRFVSAQPFTHWQKDGGEEMTGLYADPHALMPDASCIAVLFKSYVPNDAHFSPYYISSNTGHAQSAKMAEALQAEGIQALHAPKLPHRAAALRSGGILGKNSLYIHPQYGSHISLHLILLAGIEPDADGGVSPCAGCGLCVQSCPGGALPDFRRESCIRYYMGGEGMPLRLRPHVRRLLGCEICRYCCPHNAAIEHGQPTQEQLYAFDIGRLLRGEAVQARELVGSNYGRQKRMACQAALYAAANGKTEHLPQLRTLMDDSYPLLAEYAAYAVAVLEG